MQFGPPFSTRHQSTVPEKLTAIAEFVTGVHFLFGQLAETSNWLLKGTKTLVVASPLPLTSAAFNGIELVNGR